MQSILGTYKELNRSYLQRKKRKKKTNYGHKGMLVGIDETIKDSAKLWKYMRKMTMRIFQSM